MASVNPPVLSVENVSLAKNGHLLLEDITFTADCGELVAVVGPNGAGKSSLLKACCREWLPGGGSILLNGRDLGDWQPVERARVLAILPQASSLGFAYTAREVIALGRTPHTTGRQRDAAVIDELVHALQLDTLADTLYTRLSGGEKQRVQLGRVLAQVWDATPEQPALLLLDEPLAALDMKYQAGLMAILGQRGDRGLAVVMVMHDLNAAMAHADRLLALKAGRQLFFGESEHISDARLFSDLFDLDLAMFEPFGNRGRVFYPQAGRP